MQFRNGAKYLETISQHMTDSIFERQNDIQLRQCLMAQREEYSCAKRYMIWKRVLLFISVVLSVTAALINKEWLTALSCSTAVLLPIIFRRCDAKISDLKIHAAEIQQYVDATLFSPILHVDKKEFAPLLSGAVLAEETSRIAGENLEAVRNWYRDYSQCPNLWQVYYCQCENIHWDGKLRVEYKNTQNAIIEICLIIILVVSPYMELSVAKLMYLFSWIAPLIDYADYNNRMLNMDLQRQKEMKELCQNFERLQEQANSNNKEAAEALISIQQKIREHREQAFLIPDCFYKYRHRRHQEQAENFSKFAQYMSQKCEGNHENRNQTAN